MHYSIHFFGLNAKSFQIQLKTDSQMLIDRMAQRIRETRQSSDEEVENTSSYAAAICRGQIPANCSVDYFNALCWLAETACEKIAIGSFVGFRHLQFLEQTGIWPWLLRSRPPFAVPICKRPPPQVGFITASEMEQVAIPALTQLVAVPCAAANYARQEFLEVLESLADDKLDLLAVLLC